MNVQYVGLPSEQFGSASIVGTICAPARIGMRPADETQSRLIRSCGDDAHQCSFRLGSMAGVEPRSIS